MNTNASDALPRSASPSPSLTLLGLGDMGAAFARAWLAAGYSLTVWNRSPARTRALAAEGARPAATAAAAVAANRLVVTCLLDDASVGEALEGADLNGKDLVDVTTGSPEQARERDAWARARGARLLSGGIMAVPPMVCVPEAGGYVFYSGSQEVFDAHRPALSVPLDARFTGTDPGRAALLDVALLSGMYGVFAGATHALALVRGEAGVELKEFAPLLSGWLVAMASAVPQFAEQLQDGGRQEAETSNVAMQVAGIKTFVGTAREQGVSPELLSPYFGLMERLLAEGRQAEGLAGMVDLLAAPGARG